MYLQRAYVCLLVGSLLGTIVVTANDLAVPLYGTDALAKEFYVYSAAETQAKRKSQPKVTLNKTDSIIYRENGTFTGLRFDEDSEKFYYVRKGHPDREVDTAELQNVSCGLISPSPDVTGAEGMANGLGLHHHHHPGEGDGRNLASVPFYPGCYPGDAAVRSFSLGIATDLSLYQRLGESEDSVRMFVEDLIVNARLVYYRQLNVVLQIGSLRIVASDAGSNFPLNLPDGACIHAPDGALQAFRAWVVSHPDPNESNAAVHLLTGCWDPPGVVGIAYLRGLCSRSGIQTGITTFLGPSTWMIFAHELGHTIGAGHTFENGVGQTGGLMDYGNPFFQGEIQFNSLSRDSLCNGIASALADPRCAAGFQLQSTTCGDQTLDLNFEQCECVKSGEVSCGNCVDCKLVRPQQCSSELFVLPPKNPSGRYLPATESRLDDPRCCRAGKYLEATTSCDPEGSKVCSSGECVGICSAFLLIPCPVINDGCLQPCRISEQGSCHDNYRLSSSSPAPGSGRSITWLPDGTSCAVGAGTCKDGVCSVTIPRDSVAPTPRPSRRPSRRRRRHRPTKRPTGRRRRRPPTLRPTPRRPRPPARLKNTISDSVDEIYVDLEPVYEYVSTTYEDEE